MTKSCCTGVTDPCPNGIPNAACVIYTGANLPCLGVTTNDRLDVILAAIEELACDSGQNLTHNNWLTRTDDVVQWGGILVKDTSIDFDTFNVNVENIPQDNTAPFLFGQDNDGNWVKIESSTFATEIPAFTLPSTTGHNGITAPFDFTTKNYDVTFGGFLDQDTGLDFVTFNLAFLNVPTGTAVTNLGLDNVGNIVRTGGAADLTADNGLTKNTATNFQWGGTLLHDTFIAQATNDIGFSNGKVGIKTSTPAFTLTIGDNSTVGGNQTNGTFGLYAGDGTDAYVATVGGAGVGIGISIAASRLVRIIPDFGGTNGFLVVNRYLTDYVDLEFRNGGNGLIGEAGLQLDVPGVSTEFFLRANDTGSGPDLRLGYLTLYDKLKFKSIPARTTTSRIISIDVDDNVRRITGVSGTITGASTVTVVDGIITNII